MSLLDTMKRFNDALIRENARLTKIYSKLISEAKGDGIDIDDSSIDDVADTVDKSVTDDNEKPSNTSNVEDNADDFFNPNTPVTANESESRMIPIDQLAECDAFDDMMEEALASPRMISIDQLDTVVAECGKTDKTSNEIEEAMNIDGVKLNTETNDIQMTSAAKLFKEDIFDEMVKEAVNNDEVKEAAEFFKEAEGEIQEVLDDNYMMSKEEFSKPVSIPEPNNAKPMTETDVRDQGIAGLFDKSESTYVVVFDDETTTTFTSSSDKDAIKQANYEKPDDAEIVSIQRYDGREDDPEFDIDNDPDGWTDITHYLTDESEDTFQVSAGMPRASDAFNKESYIYEINDGAETINAIDDEDAATQISKIFDPSEVNLVMKYVGNQDDDPESDPEGWEDVSDAIKAELNATDEI